MSGDALLACAGSNADKGAPLAVRRGAVADDLGAFEVGCAIKVLDGPAVALRSRPGCVSCEGQPLRGSLASAELRTWHTQLHHPGEQRTSMLQWNTASSVTSAIVLSSSQHQNVTLAGFMKDLSFCFVSRLNTCRLSPASAAAFSASVLVLGARMVESAVMGRRTTLPWGSAMSTMTTWLDAPPVSRTHTYFSLCIVTCVKTMHCSGMPSDESCTAVEAVRVKSGQQRQLGPGAAAAHLDGRRHEHGRIESRHVVLHFESEPENFLSKRQLARQRLTSSALLLLRASVSAAARAFDL